MRKQVQDARNRAREAAEKQQPAADSVQPDLVGHACRLHARGAPVKVGAGPQGPIRGIMVTRQPQGPEQARQPVPPRIR